VTLLSGDSPVGVNYPAKVRAMITQTLRNLNITVIPERAIAVNAGELTLSGGAHLACDVPVIANEALPPDWLEHSGLALDSHGFVTVDGFQRSTSHHHVFAVGDAASRMDRDQPRSGTKALRAGPSLSKNLRAVSAGIEPRAPTPPHTTLHLLSGGGRSAIASWGKWSAQGRWVWWLKNWFDRGFVKNYRAK
jgi:NADH dehydrogenase FAD-containing subunit